MVAMSFSTALQSVMGLHPTWDRDRCSEFVSFVYVCQVPYDVGFILYSSF